MKLTVGVPLRDKAPISLKTEKARYLEGENNNLAFHAEALNFRSVTEVNREFYVVSQHQDTH